MNRFSFTARMRAILAVALAAAPAACCSVEQSESRTAENPAAPWGEQRCESLCLRGPGCPGGPTLASCAFEGRAPTRTLICVLERTDCPDRPGPWGDCGRRHEGSVPPVVRADGAAEVLPHLALLERESVPAFERLAAELTAHGAPDALVRDAKRAANDERMHARVMTRLARRAGATVPRWRPSRGGVRPLRSLAEENVREGCVRETYGALVAAWQSVRAADPTLRAAMRVIARDETRHAALAWRVDAWARGFLSADERAALDAIRDAEVRVLRDEAMRPVEPRRRALGLPGGDEARRLVAACAQGLWQEARA